LGIKRPVDASVSPSTARHRGAAGETNRKRPRARSPKKELRDLRSLPTCRATTPQSETSPAWASTSPKHQSTRRPHHRGDGRAHQGVGQIVKPHATVTDRAGSGELSRDLNERPAVAMEGPRSRGHTGQPQQSAQRACRPSGSSLGQTGRPPSRMDAPKPCPAVLCVQAMASTPGSPRLPGEVRPGRAHLARK
jgi:hypothetical protein